MFSLKNKKLYLSLLFNVVVYQKYNDSLGGITLHENPTIEGEVQEGLYYMGADSVLKKLGNFKGEISTLLQGNNQSFVCDKDYSAIFVHHYSAAGNKITYNGTTQTPLANDSNGQRQHYVFTLVKKDDVIYGANHIAILGVN